MRSDETTDDVSSGREVGHNGYIPAVERVRLCGATPGATGGARPTYGLSLRVRCHWGLSSASPPRPGLSPRVRGHPYEDEIPGTYVRSIPACAGSPRARGAEDVPNGVYPRVCGVTPALHYCTEALQLPNVTGRQGKCTPSAHPGGGAIVASSVRAPARCRGCPRCGPPPRRRSGPPRRAPACFP